MDRTMKSSDDEAGRGPKDDLPNPARNSMTRRSQLSGSAHKSGQAGAAGTTGLEPSTLSLHLVHVSEISVHVYIEYYCLSFFMRPLLTRYPSSEDSDFHLHQKTLTSLRFIYLKISELDVPDVLSHVVACFFSYLSQHHLSQELEQLQREKEPRIPSSISCP